MSTISGHLIRVSYVRESNAPDDRTSIGTRREDSDPNDDGHSLPLVVGEKVIRISFGALRKSGF
jgi:hypothetical protein